MKSLISSVEAFLDHKFTHLIIGGGTAGLVVAARLSENPDLTVAILEAGPAAFDERRINVPGRGGECLGSEYDWKFETVAQAGVNGRVLPWARGKVLGGSSALNFMTWNRGNLEDYDAWEELGNEGWGWEGLLLVFSLRSACSLFETILFFKKNILPLGILHGNSQLHCCVKVQLGCCRRCARA